MGQAAVSRVSGFRLILVSIAIGIGTFLIALDTFIANVSIPTISGELGVSANEGSWVITTFTVANAIVVPLTGWLTSMFGRVRLFCFSSIAFSLFSWVCGLSISLPMLLVARFLQGLSSGCLIPLSQTLLISIYPPEKKGLALGLWGLVAMVGPVLGPVLGGWITDSYGWGWIFYINVPFGIFAGLTTFFILSSQESERKMAPMDICGLVLYVVGISALQILLDRGNDLDWWGSSFIVTLTIISIVALVLFVIWELFQENPVIEIKLFKNKTFAIGTAMASFTMLVIFSSLIIEPLWTQAQLNYTPMWSGMTLAPFGVFAIILFPLMGLILDWIDLRFWITLGCLIFIFTFYEMSNLYIGASYASIALPRLWQGAAFAMLFVPLTAITLSDVPEEKLASGAGIFSFARMFFIGVGVSLAITFWDRRAQFYQSRFGEWVIPAYPAYGEYYEDLATQNIVGDQANAYVYKEVINQAYTMSLLDLFYFGAWIFVFVLLVSFTLRYKKKKLEKVVIGD